MHEIRQFSFDLNKTKSEISNYCDDYATEHGEYHHGLSSPIDFIDKTFDNRDMASQELDRLGNNSFYGAFAVKYYEYPQIDKTTKELDFERRIKETRDKLVAYREKTNVKNFKAQYIGCSKCGSKLNKDFLSYNTCPLCRNSLESETTRNTIKGYEEKIKDLQEQMYQEHLRVELKNKSKAKVKWLVQFEYHV